MMSCYDHEMQYQLLNLEFYLPTLAGKTPMQIYSLNCYILQQMLHLFAILYLIMSLLPEKLLFNYFGLMPCFIP